MDAGGRTGRSRWRRETGEKPRFKSRKRVESTANSQQCSATWRLLSFVSRHVPSSECRCSSSLLCALCFALISSSFFFSFFLSFFLSPLSSRFLHFFTFFFFFFLVSLASRRSSPISQSTFPFFSPPPHVHSLPPLSVHCSARARDEGKIFNLTKR